MHPTDIRPVRRGPGPGSGPRGDETSIFPAKRALRTALCLGALLLTASPALAGEISGTAFKDLNRDGVLQDDEPRLADQQLYLFAGDETYLGVKYTDAAGRYAFAGLADGEYSVRYAAPSWWSLRDDWVPTTTGSVRPTVRRRLVGSSTADFGWRRIVRSTDPAAPISSYTGPNGLRVRSYDDVVAAKELYDALALGLTGAEAPLVTVNFDLGSSSTTTSSFTESNGRYSGYAADSFVTYASWLDNADETLSHEYGHAWSLYYAYIVQQDPSLTAYVRARGLEGDPRLGSSYPWRQSEMIAEDYRQLFGSPTAQAGPQMNREIPPARDVPGLRDFLQNVFTRPPVSSPPPPAPAPTLEISGLGMEPAPVRTTGTASFSVSVPASVTLTVRDAKGSTVKALLTDSTRQAGPVSAAWDRTDSRGRRVKRGTYSLRAEARDASGQAIAASASFSVY